MDISRSHQITINPDDPRQKRWLKDPGSMDILGVDNPASVTKATRIVKIRAPKTPPKPPKPVRASTKMGINIKRTKGGGYTRRIRTGKII